MSPRFPKRHSPEEVLTTVLPQLANAIVEAIHPVKILLFGSYARGDFRPESDVDLLVVIRDDVDQRAAWDEAYLAACRVHVGVDLVLVKVSALHALKGDPYLIYAPALAEGRELYTAETVPEPDSKFKLGPIHDWIDLAESALAMATLDDPRLQGYEGRVHSAFRAVLCAEKAACKAKGVRFHPKIDLAGLNALLEASAGPAPPEIVQTAMETLSRYAELEWVPALDTRVTRAEWGFAVRAAATAIDFARSLSNLPAQPAGDPKTGNGDGPQIPPPSPSSPIGNPGNQEAAP